MSDIGSVGIGDSNSEWEDVAGEVSATAPTCWDTPPSPLHSSPWHQMTCGSTASTFHKHLHTSGCPQIPGSLTLIVIVIVMTIVIVIVIVIVSISNLQTQNASISCHLS